MADQTKPSDKEPSLTEDSSTYIIVKNPEQFVRGHAHPIWIRNKPHLITCAHLVIGAIRVAYRGVITKTKFVFIDCHDDIAILRWYHRSEIRYEQLAEPDFSSSSPTSAELARAHGDCGIAVRNSAGNLVGLVNSFDEPMPVLALWRAVQSYVRFGRPTPLPQVPHVAEHTLIKADEHVGSAIDLYWRSKFVTDTIQLTYQHTSGTTFTATFQLEGRGQE